MAVENRSSSPSHILPPIAMLASRSPTTTYHSMPASPPNTGYDKANNKHILPKLSYDHFPSASSEILSPPINSTYYPTPDQKTLWTLFNQFQQQQQQENSKERRASDPITSDRALTSEEVLAEKRRRNAGASARFRDRRKQREKELQERCHQLEERAKDLENALKYFDADHPLLLQPSTENNVPTHNNLFTEQHTLFERVGQLEQMMTVFKQEKETDVQKLDELEKENKYLRSLLIPVHLASNRHSSDESSSKRSRSSSISDEDKNVQKRQK